MHIIIDHGASVPIYEQVQRQIRDQILKGELAFDEQLPSIRALARDLSISIMTVKKAYDALEREGLILTRQGKGSYVAEKNENTMREARQREIEAHLEAAVKLAKAYEISKQEMIAMVEFMFGDE